jgi:hypothetical protein
MGKTDKRLHARTQAADMADRWEATFGRAPVHLLKGQKVEAVENRTEFWPSLDAPPETP